MKAKTKKEKRESGKKEQGSDCSGCHKDDPCIKVDPKDQKIAELTNLLKMVQADFENYKKRVEKERSEVISYAKEQMISKLLPVLDSFEIALKTNATSKEFEKGVKMIYAQIFTMLQKEGLRPIDTKNQKFDPYRHEVMLQEHSDKEDGAILEELQKGYWLGDRVIRHSKVKISKR